MKNKFRLITLAVVLVFSMAMLAGCGGSTETPTDALNNYFKAVKADDKDAIQKAYAGKVDSSLGESLLDSSNDSLPKEIQKSMLKKILDFDYELSNENIDGDKASVDATITTYDIGSALESFMKVYFEKAMKVATEKNAEKKIEKMAGKLFNKEIKKLKEKTFSKKVTVELEQKDGKWVVSELDEPGDLADALTGGIFSKLEEIGQ